MKIAIMQPYFLPYLGYWQLIAAVDKFILFDDVNYIKKGYINRNNILLSNQSYMFTIPVNKPSQNKLINETYFSNDENAKQNFIKTLTIAYKKAPYFDNVYPILKNIIFNSEPNVAKYIKHSIEEILSYIGIEKEIVFSSTTPVNDDLKAQHRILALCKKHEAICYINAIGGQELYDRESFAKENIDLKFIKMNGDIKYQQFKNEFVPNLSIIDVMMFNSPEQIKEMLGDYTLI